LDNAHYLSPLFTPGQIAVIGATERAGALGSTLIRNLQRGGYRGALHAVNPKYATVFGLPCVPHIAAVPGPIDLAIIATPAPSVVARLEECGQAGVRTAAVLAAGFGETGSAGLDREDRTAQAARHWGLRLLRPNTFGLLRPGLGLNASFAANDIAPGPVGVISQSGALCAAVLDHARDQNLGLSALVALGRAADLDFGEVIDFLACDPATEAILIHVESLRNARRFVSALNAAARSKPVMVLKTGRHPSGARATLTHTGTPAGDNAVFDAALRRCGVVRLSSLEQFLNALSGLALRCRPVGSRLTIITNGGGPGVLAAHRAGDLGLTLARLAPQTIAGLEPVLPSHWSRANPVDLCADAPP